MATSLIAPLEAPVVHREVPDLDALRGAIAEPLIARHWRTTGRPTLDARARAHVAEWLAFHHRPDPAETFWELHTVEAHDGDTLITRCLRTQTGHCIDHVEGRELPPTGSVVGLRIDEHHDLVTITLPLLFGTPEEASDVMLALLRGFGASPHRQWPAFLRRRGARILLEHALSRLELEALRPNSRSPLDPRVIALQDAFTRLEARYFNAPDTLTTLVALPESCGMAVIEDAAGGPLLRIHRFEEGEAYCRLRRICAEECETDLLEHAREVGLKPQEEGLVILEKRHPTQGALDPTEADFAALAEALRGLQAPMGCQAVLNSTKGRIQ